MSDTWLLAMDKAIEVVDAKSASLDVLTTRYTDMLDKSIDHVLTALRADTPSVADCKQAMTGLLKTFDSLQGKK